MNRRYRMQSLNVALGAALAVLTWSGSAWAVTQTFTGNSSNNSQNLSASVTFTVSGDDLLIDLKNTAQFSTRVENRSVLTAVLFDVQGGSPDFTGRNKGLMSATKNTGTSLIWTGSGGSDAGDYRSRSNAAGGTTRGGWDFEQSTDHLRRVTQSYGLGTAGLGIFGGDTSSGGPGSPANYGVVQAGSLSFSGGLRQNTPLVQDVIHFVLRGTNLSDITGFTNVRFQWGTSLSEPNAEGYLQPASIPEPSTLAIAGLGILGLLGVRLVRRPN